MIVEPELEAYIYIHFAIKNQLATWTELTEKMNVLDVEYLIHVEHARRAQGQRIKIRNGEK